MTEDPHIVIIAPGFASDETDDTTIPPLQVFLKAYQKRYPETKFSIIALQYPYEKKVYVWNGIKVYSCGGQNRRGLHKFKTWQQAKSYFKEIATEEKPTLIHSLWLNEAALIGNYLAKKHELKHVVTLMGQDALNSNKYLKIIDLQYPNLIALSKYHQQAFNNIYPKIKTEVIPWGIDETEFSSNGQIRKYDILGVGSIIPLKQYELFIRIVGAAKAIKPDIKAAIAGTGPDFRKLIEIITASGLGENIELPGQLPRQEVLKLMSQSKIFLHTSSYESQGYVLTEALAAGMNVASMRVGIAGELEHIRTADSEEELKSIILEMVSGESNYLKRVPVTIDQTVNAYHMFYAK